MIVTRVKVQDNDSPRVKKSRVYFFVDDETILEDLVQRHQRPHQAYKQLLPQVFSMAKLKPREATWKQTAGCSCGCSPGFVLDDNDAQEIFVHIS